MSQEFIHLHTSRLHRNHNIFFLFIPGIIFAILIAVLFSMYKEGRISILPKPNTVLGTQSSNP